MRLMHIKIPLGLAFFGGLVLLIVLGDKFLPKMEYVKYMVWNCNSREMSVTRSDTNYSIKLSVTPGQTVGS